MACSTLATDPQCFRDCYTLMDSQRVAFFLQATFPVAQLERGQLLEGWVPLTNEDGSTIAKHQSMLNVVLQYQSVLQVGFMLSLPTPAAPPAQSWPCTWHPSLPPLTAPCTLNHAYPCCRGDVMAQELCEYVV